LTIKKKSDKPTRASYFTLLVANAPQWNLIDKKNFFFRFKDSVKKKKIIYKDISKFF
jgi:hypothetical protein